jgi:hypothetical protein
MNSPNAQRLFAFAEALRPPSIGCAGRHLGQAEHELHPSPELIFESVDALPVHEKLVVLQVKMDVRSLIDKEHHVFGAPECVANLEKDVLVCRSDLTPFFNPLPMIVKEPVRV